MAKKMPIGDFVAGLQAAVKRKDGYIMGAKGQNPKKWKETSWWYTQYEKGDRRNKALYWRENAERVWDCNGMAEGLYEDFSGVNINTKARYNYSGWCGTKGKGLIPTEHRVPGAAVFWGDTASDIHHVAYLEKPVEKGKPDGDWYIIEARGVMYGVVRTKLNSRKPNFWGLMTKYFDYDNTKVTVEKQKNVKIVGGNCWMRSEPNTSGKKVAVAIKGKTYQYGGETAENGWNQIVYNGQKVWVSGKYSEVGN